MFINVFIVLQNNRKVNEGGIMKTEKNIFWAFLLNLLFSIFEFVGGAFIGSVAIVSDALHDASDAATIGISYLLEKKSHKAPDENYTYGYTRYSVVGGLITTTILIFGSIIVIAKAIERIINPNEINYDGMIIFAVVGVIVNIIAAFLTHKGDSLNQKAVNLHLIEDVLGWVVVLIGAIVMKFTDIAIIDPILSIVVAIFIMINAIVMIKEVLDIFLQKAPKGFSVKKIKSRILEIDGVSDVHHIHIWSMDGQTGCCTMHIVTDYNHKEIKDAARDVLKKYGISHSTLELENSDEECLDKHCRAYEGFDCENCHHHHSHH